MRRLSGLVLVAALLGACGANDEPTPAALAEERVATARGAAPEPDLAACPKVARAKDDPLPPEAPLAVPAPFKGMVASGLDHFAVSTLAGEIACIDTIWMSEIADAKVSADKRFLSFGYSGYETFGHLLVDRADKGTVVDTGQAPTFSPSRKLVAGLQVSEAGWGGLEGFAIWQVTPSGLDDMFTMAMDADGVLPEVFRQDMADWRIDEWVGEDCLAISATSYEALNAVEGDFAKARRTPFHARRVDGWAVRTGQPEGCSAT